jgi:phage RecT family recombinase
MAAAQKPEPGTAVATQDEPRQVTARDLPAVIRRSKTARAQLAAFLPPGVSLERVAASVDLALRKARADWAEACRNDRTKTGLAPLERCEPGSILLAVAKIQQWGLEIGETAHLVPFGTSCTPVADYKGLSELMVASGVAKMVEAHCVYEKEPFRLKRGTVTEVEHHPIGDPKARGDMVGAYAIVHVRGNLPLTEYMSVDEIDKIRQEKSKQWKKGPLPEWYARKTVIRRIAKYVPKNPRLAKLLAEIDAEQVIDVPAELAAAMVTTEDTERLPAPQRGPKALVEGGYGDAGAAVNTAPIPPAQHSDDPAGRDDDFDDEDWQDDTDLRD